MHASKNIFIEILFAWGTQLVVTGYLKRDVQREAGLPVRRSLNGKSVRGVKDGLKESGNPGDYVFRSDVMTCG